MPSPPPRKLGGTYFVGCPPGAAGAGVCRAASFVAAAAIKKINVHLKTKIRSLGFLFLRYVFGAYRCLQNGGKYEKDRIITFFFENLEMFIKKVYLK